MIQTMRSRDRDVVLKGCAVGFGKPRGVGKLEWRGNGEWEASLRATWDQGGRDRTTQEEGFQVSEKGFKGKKELAIGVNKEKPARGYWQRVAPSLNIANLCIYILYHCMNAANKRMCLGYK